MPVRLYYGAKPDSYDPRDVRKKYSSHQIPSQQCPKVDLRRYVDHVYDQGRLSSCTANAVCAAYGLRLKMQSQTLEGGYYCFNTSRLFLYYNTRRYYKGDITKDTGASLRNTVKSLKQYGVSKEVFWPYNPAKFAQMPPAYSYDSGKGNNLCRYECLTQDIDQFRACLKDNCPFVFGFKVYRSFHSIGENGYVMPMPTHGELLNQPEGRHAVVAVGYDDRSQCIIGLNSWGAGWGEGGYFYMPYAFVKNADMCSDFWRISFACQWGKPPPS